MKAKKIIPILITLVLIIVVVIGISYGLKYTRKNSYLKKYKEYSNTIQENGLDKYYSSKDANAYEYVTYAEAVGLCVYANTKFFRIEDLGYSEKINVLNAASVDYINEKGIKTNLELTEENANKYIPRIEVINILGQMKEKILEKSLNKDKVTLTITKAHKLDEKRLEYLKDAVKTGVLENKGSVDETSYIRRGELNRIILTYLNVENPIGSEFGEVVTDKEKLPANADKYPFILADVEKEVYEIEQVGADSEGGYTPANLYKISKDSINTSVPKIEGFTNLLLNVDYKTIDADELISKYNETMQYDVEEEKLREYVEYVKKHKLVLKGTTKVIIPCLYYNGFTYRIRQKVTLEILEGDTKTNILFGDTEESTYKDKGTYIVDSPATRGIFSVDFFPQVYSFQDFIVKEI